MVAPLSAASKRCACAPCAQIAFARSRGAFLQSDAMLCYRVPHMEMLVYVRNHGGRRQGSTHVGASVGEAPVYERLEMTAPLTSLAEFRVDAEVDDPIAELRDAVQQVFDVMGSVQHGRPTYVARRDSAIFVVLEAGFDTPSEVMGELAEILALSRPKARRAAESRPDEPTVRA
jgi:hypothetical protein